MQRGKIRYILPFQGIVFAFLVLIASISFNGCQQTDRCSNKARCEMLDSIEVQMFERPENLDSLLGKVDTTNMTPHEQARIGTIRGLTQFYNQEYDKSINELGKAETYFFNQRDDYHLHICKLIKAFTFEYLNLDPNAGILYVECEDYFKANHLDKFKFYATLGLYRMSKQLLLDKNKLIERLKNAAGQLNNTHYNALLYATMGVFEPKDSLKIIYYEQAKSELISGHRWSRVYAIDLNLLFLRIKQDPSENAQIYYDNFSNKSYFYNPTVLEQMRYKYGQAYLYAKQGKNYQSIEAANQVLEEAVALKITKVEFDCVQLLAFLYKRTHDFSNAHRMLERFQSLQQKDLNELQQIRLLALGAHYKYSELENEKLELKLKVQKFLLIFGVISLIFVLGFSIVWISLKKSKHKQEVLKLENMEIQDQFNNLLRSLGSQEPKDEKLIRMAEELGNQYADSIKVTKLLDTIKQNEKPKWTEYETIFNELRPGWVGKLKQTKSELSSTEIKYCMCFYFDLKNKTIKELLGIGNDAIKSARKRIRDKFVLDESKDIHTYLNDSI